MNTHTHPHTHTHTHTQYTITLAVDQVGTNGVKVLTDTNWKLSGPVVVLLADPHRGANEPESRVALVNHCVSVTEVFPDNLSIYNLLWNTTVTGCEMRRKE